jgi:hypothetical protein
MNLSIGPMSKYTHVREPMPLGRKKQDAENAENAVGVSGWGSFAIFRAFVYFTV